MDWTFIADIVSIAASIVSSIFCIYTMRFEYGHFTAWRSYKREQTSRFKGIHPSRPWPAPRKKPKA